MEYQVTVVMALVDYLPVLCFGIAALLLMKDFYGKMGLGVFLCFAAGMADVFIAGFCKASWKLLYAAGVCDFQSLNSLFLPLQSIGFLLAGIGMLIYVLRTRALKDGGEPKALALVPPVFSGSFVFIGMMVLGLGAVCAGLSILAKRKKRVAAIVLFALCFTFSLCMGYLSSRDSTSAVVNWIEESVNCCGQACLLIGVILLRKKEQAA